MAKSIQSFEAWGYVVDPNAEGYKGVEFTAGEKHCNIYHPDAVDATMPINTFSVTEDKGMLKIPRAFNQSPDYDRRPKHQKLKVRDQIVSYWSMVENRSLKDLKKIHYTAVIERNLRDRMEEVYEMKGADEFDELTLQPPEPAFQLLLTNTPFLAGVQKMLDEYADKFAGKTIQSCTFHPIGGFALHDFTITLT
jgi:hypothetical protein